MANLTELLAQRAALDNQIEKTQREDRDKALDQIRRLMSEYGLKAADLGGRKPAKSGSGSKVAAKYRDRASGETWSGRGLQPRWLKAALASGKTLGDFSV